MAARNVSLDTVIEAVRRSNNDVGGRLIQIGESEYIVRGIGYIRRVSDLENIVILAHYFPLSGVQQEWTIIARYTFSVEKTAEGWRIRKVVLDPIHYRGNMLGLEFVQGKQLI